MSAELLTGLLIFMATIGLLCWFFSSPSSAHKDDLK